ncbi:MAG TPA: superoxide dismutase family protein [Verrucomicrobiae bacterium]|nr:superoxide dismutase family protein [Verrucomicrobiae bacterium]
MRVGILTMALVVASVVAARTASGTLASGQPAVTRAIAVLVPTEANSVSGTVTFTKVPAGVRVVADMSGLTPGLHGFQIREFGNCGAPDASSTGGDFNPSGMPHAGPNWPYRQVGDLGNVLADASGKAHYDAVNTMILLDGPTSIVGRAVTVHQRADDLKSQPSGNVGPAVACGVIGIAGP